MVFYLILREFAGAHSVPDFPMALSDTKSRYCQPDDVFRLPRARGDLAFKWKRVADQRNEGRISQSTFKLDNGKVTDMVDPEVYSPDGSITCPSTSIALVMFIVARIDAATIQIDARAMCCPGLKIVVSNDLNDVFESLRNLPHTPPKAKCDGWVGNGWVQPAVLKESFGFEFEWIGVHRLVV